MNPSELNNTMSDEAVLMLSITNPNVFSIIMDRYQQAFLRKAAGIVGQEDSHDVVQEAFVRIYIAAPKFKKQEGATFSSWAYKILLNQCFTLYQKRKKERGASVQLDPELFEMIPDGNAVENFGAKLDSEYLLSLVSRLPDILGRVVRLHFIEGKPQAEVAEIEGISNGVVRARIHRAKKELRKISVEM